MQKIMTNVFSVVIVGLIISAFIVADKNIGMGLMAIAIGLATFIIVVDKDFRGKF